jgi:CheY-like chemotaxis protein/AraC-like DNA-binding protein
MATVVDENRLHRFALVNAGHEFLLNVLPPREPESRAALVRFVDVVARSQLASADIDAVLLRCLAVLDGQDSRIPSLVEQYLAGAAGPQSPLERFNACVDSLLRHHGVTHGCVQHALEIITGRISDSRLTPRAIADETGIRLATLDVAFKRQTGHKVTEHIRTTRLERAAVQLATTGKSIKEVWSQVGYNHASNFAHDFKRHFGVSSQEFRARAIRPLAQKQWAGAGASVRAASTSGDRRLPVMIIDDNETTTSTLCVYLRCEGYSVVAASTGAEGLQQAKRLSPSAILVDYNLDDMTGLEFLRELRRHLSGDTPGLAIFTADWGVFDHADDIHALNAIVASKLCNVDQIKDLIAYLSASPRSVSERARFW